MRRNYVVEEVQRKEIGNWRREDRKWRRKKRDWGYEEGEEVEKEGNGSPCGSGQIRGEDMRKGLEVRECSVHEKERKKS